ncbi:PDGLE domain-containing protein [Patescibacteria group bacterium]|nr:PDGLE domain-containing protein [Patescibacteria group bacterium]MBU1951612.1 PDGLE domain-containing protein [Patescibacteria group bacterium]
MNKKYIVLLIVSVLLAGVISLFASSSPDGLERVAEEKGFITSALKYPLQVFMPDYELGIVNNSHLAVMLAGILGTVAVFIFVYFTVRTLSIKK